MLEAKCPESKKENYKMDNLFSTNMVAESCEYNTN